MKVLYLHGGGREIGGLDKYFINILPLLIKKGIEPTVICSRSWPLQERLRVLGAGIIPVYLPSWTKPKHFLRSVFLIVHLLRLIGKTGAQLIQASGFYHAPYVALAAKISRRPCVAAPIGELSPRFVSRYLLRAFDRVVAVSSAAKDSLMEAGIKKERLVVSHHGVAAYRYKREECVSDLRKSLGVGERDPLFCTVANINFDKGQDVLIHAMARLARMNTQSTPQSSQQTGGFFNTRFYCVFVGLYSETSGTGNREYYDSLLKLIREYGLDRSIIFTGFVDDVRPYLAASDIFVLPSRTEALGIALLEAMAMGLPVIATRVGGVPDVVVDRETGILVAPEDPGKLAEEMLSILERPGLQRLYGESGAERVKSHFDLESEAQRHLNIYQSLIHAS